jgi:hypothetical protein
MGTLIVNSFLFYFLSHSSCMVELGGCMVPRVVTVRMTGWWSYYVPEN